MFGGKHAVVWISGIYAAGISSADNFLLPEVNTTGGVEAASVAVIQTRSLSPANEIEMIVDKPFLFVIRNRLTRPVLFLARVDNPRSLYSDPYFL